MLECGNDAIRTTLSGQFRNFFSHCNGSSVTPSRASSPLPTVGSSSSSSGGNRPVHGILLLPRCKRDSLERNVFKMLLHVYLGHSSADTEMRWQNIKGWCRLPFQFKGIECSRKMQMLFSLSYRDLLSLRSLATGWLAKYKWGMDPSFDMLSALCFVQWRRKVCEQCWPLLRIYVHRMYLKRDVARALCGTTISGWTWITWKLPQQLRDVLHISQLSFTLKYGPTYKSKLNTFFLFESKMINIL